MAGQCRAFNTTHEIEVLITYLRRGLEGQEREDIKNLSEALAKLLGIIEGYEEVERVAIVTILTYMMTEAPEKIQEGLRGRGKFEITIVGGVTDLGPPRFHFSKN